MGLKRFSTVRKISKFPRGSRSVREVSIFLVYCMPRMKEEGRMGGNMLFEDVE